MKRAINLQHDTAAVGEDPCAVQVSTPSVAVAADLLAIWGLKAGPSAKVADVNLGEGLSPPSDVSEGKSKLLPVAKLGDVQAYGEKTLSIGKALLDTSGEEADPDPTGTLTFGGQQGSLVESKHGR